MAACRCWWAARSRAARTLAAARETLLRGQLVDVLDISVHPIAAGSADLLFREGQGADMRLVAVKAFSEIVKLSYEPRYPGQQE